MSGQELPNIFEECSHKPGTGSAHKVDTADSSNRTKTRNKIMTFYDYCQEEDTVLDATKLPYL